jgi:hypothetical protein
MIGDNLNSDKNNEHKKATSRWLILSVQVILFYRKLHRLQKNISRKGIQNIGAF